ncbi:hypothetical protein KBB96_14590 [Luteolibacter ambystomatis]|uniref:Lipoprotein n=1 Tax=Luteolibacter ambystomatis TaxID=2824561 RepID=A0A975G7B0_9BACT|nr:hypothetical protein [Luteolibacter ambystomatis]QUE50091.1 hypothetical protein KBB96_14590 [Luteolibacter ambystomatis]
MTASTKIAAIAAVCACGLSSCDRQGDPGLRERVSLLEAELSQRDDSLKNLKEEISKKEKEADSASSSSSSSAPAAADPAKARQSYLAAVETIQASLAKSLGSDGAVDRASVFPVTGPDPDYPISSKVGFTILAKNGRKAEIVVPLVANAAGEWKEPTGDEIAAQFRKSLSSMPAVADNTGTAPTPTPQPQPTRPQPQPNRTPNDVMGANRTVQVGWDEPTVPAPQPQRPANPTPQPQPTPQPPAQKPAGQPPVKPMPSNRDVIIDFDR